ncbi:phospholipase A2 inhibitor NAI-like [Engystomops pustulosus]|uniref:phospholipase A2 inhibitor NAI-like n=1 Tax=Engystomops pustulosus TaxID=76066 RepID=UPI003AFB6FAA
MKSLLRSLSLFSTLITTSSALSCTQCISATSLSCSGSSVTCPPGHVCGSSYGEYVMGGSTTPTLIRTCVSSFECDIVGSMSMQQGQIRVATTCCNNDNCSPAVPVLPALSSEPNGMVCPSCIHISSTSCSVSDTVQCTGQENMCLTAKISGSVSASPVIQGCATKSLCDIGNESLNIGGVMTEVTYICSNDTTRTTTATSAAQSVHGVLLLTAIVGFLLLKLFSG